ncbi:MAG TPA: autotransporter-associated beta strand repeat-containing protein, partial [Terrimicrobiaceae bacterium]|nr:autotransporter-associated beta strand repeat-containing protein [Terrimicrobiaceae bacterium]
ANQVWTTGTAAAGTSQIVVNGLVSGTGSLTLNGTAGFANTPVYLNNGGNTFSGGVTLNSGAAVRFSGSAISSSGTTSSSAIGAGNLTINGGTIYGAGSFITPAVTTVNGDFAVNTGTSALNGRLTFGGGTIDLGNASRTVSLGRYATAAGVLTGGFESFRLLQGAGAPVLSVQSGTMRFVRDALSSPTASDYVSVNFGPGSTFASGAGLTIGDHVITSMASTNPFGTTAGAQPNVIVESGGYFNMSDATNARSPVIRSLSGTGTVTSFTTVSGTSVLTINPQSGDSATFAGTIVDGSTLTSVVAGATGVVAITKTGTGIQILSGNNQYSGATVVSVGTLVINGDQSLSTGSVTISANATLAGDGTVGGATTGNGNAVIRPGSTGLSGSIGSLAFSQSLNANNADFLMEIASPLSFDSIVITGAFTMSGDLVVDALSALGTSTYNLFDFGSKSGNFASVTVGGSALTRSGDVWTDTGGLYSFNQADGVLTTVPEPSTWMLLGLGFTGLMFLRRGAKRS